MKEVFISGRSLFSGKALKIGITGGIVSSVEKGDDSSNLLSPGLMDLQINGYRSKDYSSGLSLPGIEELVGHFLQRGITQHFPTIITNKESRLINSIVNIVEARKKSKMVENCIRGIHIEGPFISPYEGSRGVHDLQYIRKADFSEFLRWQEAAEGLIRIVTVSPEDDNSILFIEKVVESGVIAAIGHTNAEPEMIDRAVDAGARLSTHLGNGTAAMIPRLKNNIWKQLSDDRLSASFIADGFHIPLYVLKCFFAGKGRDHSILVSDVAALGGNKPGLYKWGNMDIEIFEDGHMGLYKTGNLAGSSLLLNQCITYLIQNGEYTLPEIMRWATMNPRKLVGADWWESEPPVGKKADIISFTVDDQVMNINKVVSFDTYIDNEEKGNL